jgi:fido (protein-threonine AMPylation protein)
MAKLFSDCDYLGRFELSRDHINFTDKVFFDLDESIRNHIVFDNQDLENYLIAQAEFLSTFSTAKIEGINDLSDAEAKKILNNFLGLGKDEPLPVIRKKELDIREFKNIVRGFRMVCEDGLGATDISVNKLKAIHQTLTEDLDRLSHGVSGAEPEYKSGMFRDSDVWIGGMYTPAKLADIEREVEAAISFYKGNRTIVDAFIFSLAIYVIHPFNNGNKRVCRIMEHGLLRGLGINRENTYSHIVETYHVIERYKDALQASLGRKILNNFVNMQLESLFWAQMHTLRSAVEFSRRKFVEAVLGQQEKKHLAGLLNYLITSKALRFKDIKIALGGINDKIVASLLNFCIGRKLLRKHVQGRDSFYTLAFDSAAEKDLNRYYKENRDRLTYTPDIFSRSILMNAEHFD